MNLSPLQFGQPLTNKDNIDDYDFSLGWFEYKISGKIIILTQLKDEYRKTISKNVLIPSKVQIDDEDYYLWFPQDCTLYFADCSGLKNLKVDAHMDRVGTIESMFKSCWNLETVIFNTTFEYLVSARNCFSDCTVLRSVKMKILGDALTDISNMCYNCYELKEAQIEVLEQPYNLKNKDSIFKNCDKLNIVITGRMDL